jgi:hypothetical protein
VRTALVCGLTAIAGAIAVSPCAAQARVTSLEQLRRELATDDFVIVVPFAGQPVSGRLIRLDQVELGLRLVAGRTPRDRTPQTVTIRFDTIRTLERPRDPVRNGTLLGAGIGAGIGAGMFLNALVVDRNEVDEWAPIYLGATAICAGAGALLGWAIDAARSKPHLTFDASIHARNSALRVERHAAGRMIAVTVQPLYSRHAGFAIAAVVSR